MNGVDQLERAPCVAAAVLGRFNPDGKELRVETTRLGACEVEHARAERIDEVPLFIEKALGGVGVTVDHGPCGAEAFTHPCSLAVNATGSSLLQRELRRIRR